MFKRFILILCGLMVPVAGWSQVVEPNVGNYRDPRIIFINPAATGWNESLLLVAGFERYYMGLPDDNLQSGFASFSMPVGNLGNVGLTAQYFSSDIFHQGLYSLTFGRSLWQQKLCLGFDIGMRSISYDRDNFHLFDPADPVFSAGSSKNVMDLGISGIVHAYGPLYLGFAARHLNEPNISLIDDPMTVGRNLQAGIKVNYTLFSPLFNLSHQDDRYEFDYGFESWFLEESAMFRSTFSGEDLRIGAGYIFDTPKRILRLDYEFRYPISDLNTVANGFHQFVISYTPGLAKEDPIELEQLSGNIAASTDTLLIEEYIRIHRRDPIFANVFFAENDNSLNPERYKIFNAERNPLHDFIFFPEEVQGVSSQYSNTLNIIAKRLLDNPWLRITLTGCNSDWGNEKGNLELSLNRAEEVRDYLIHNCGVDAEQITVGARQLPKDHADSSNALGREENQRVEITCSDSSDAVLDPLQTKTMEMTTSHNECAFQFVNLVTDAGLAEWKITINTASGENFRILQGPPEALPIIVWDWRSNNGTLVSPDTKYSYQLHLTDIRGQTYVAREKNLFVEKTTEVDEIFGDREMEVTRLILFKYNSAALNLESKFLVDELDRIIGQMQEDPTATLEVNGYTDIIGSATYNRNLSQRRADAVAHYCSQNGVALSRISSYGLGENTPIMDNQLPEGRMLNRRVEILFIY